MNAEAMGRRLIHSVIEPSLPVMNDSTTDSQDTRPLRFGPRNAILAVLGVGCLAGGYALLSGGSITAAPLLLVLGYVVLLPLAILL